MLTNNFFRKIKNLTFVEKNDVFLFFFVLRLLLITLNLKIQFLACTLVLWLRRYNIFCFLKFCFFTELWAFSIFSNTWKGDCGPHKKGTNMIFGKLFLIENVNKINLKKIKIFEFCENGRHFLFFWFFVLRLLPIPFDVETWFLACALVLWLRR